MKTRYYRRRPDGSRYEVFFLDEPEPEELREEIASGLEVREPTWWDKYRYLVGLLIILIVLMTSYYLALRSGYDPRHDSPWET